MAAIMFRTCRAFVISTQTPKKSWYNLLQVNLTRYFRAQVVPASASKKRLSVKEILATEPVGSQITIAGWIGGVRRQKDHVFFDLGDGSCHNQLQVVAETNSAPKQLTYGACVKVSGRLIRSNHSAQSVELQPSSIQVIGICNPEEYPFQTRKWLPADYMRQFAHLRPRTRTFGALLRARNAATMVVHEAMQDQDFVFIATPIMTANDCEGGGEVFTVKPLCEKNASIPVESKFFEKDTFLTVSAQFHLEAAACGLTNVYTLGPTFRAENSKSRYHLAEFQMLEAEMAFVESLDDLTTIIERLVKSITEKLFKRSFDDIKYLRRQNGLRDSDSTKRFLEQPFIRLTYRDALEIIGKRTDTPPIKWGEDLAKIHEQRLVEHCGQTPVFISKFPASLKPFYMKRSDDSASDTVEAVDLLVPNIGELCGGSVREHQFEILEKRLRDAKLHDNLKWYLDLRKYGSCAHSGFGIGFERYLQFVLGINSIKDCVLFPCYPHHCPH